MRNQQSFHFIDPQWSTHNRYENWWAPSPGSNRLVQRAVAASAGFGRECWLWMWLLQSGQCRHQMISIHFYVCYWMHYAFVISFHTRNVAYHAADVGSVSLRGIPDLSTLSLQSLFCSQPLWAFTLVHLFALGAGRWSWCRVPDQSKATVVKPTKDPKDSVLP